MKKILVLSLIFAVALGGSVFAQSQGKYVRKQVRPLFFIPEKELNKKEVLPEFGAKKPTRGVDTPLEVEKSQDMKKGADALKAELNDIANGKDTSLPVKTSGVRKSNLWQTNDNGLSNSPEYQKKYDDYLSDLKIIAKTGKAPPNDALDKDLAEMGSDEKLLVDPKLGIRNR